MMISGTAWLSWSIHLLLNEIQELKWLLRSYLVSFTGKKWKDNKNLGKSLWSFSKMWAYTTLLQSPTNLSQFQVPFRLTFQWISFKGCLLPGAKKPFLWWCTSWASILTFCLCLILSDAFSATSVAQLYFEQIYKLHGLPKTIVSDRHNVFLGRFWIKLFTFQQHMSTSYHLRHFT